MSEASATLTQLGGIYDSPRHIDRQDRVRLLGSGLGLSIRGLVCLVGTRAHFVVDLRSMTQQSESGRVCSVTLSCTCFENEVRCIDRSSISRGSRSRRACRVEL